MPRRGKAATIPVDPDYITHERDVTERRDMAFIRSSTSLLAISS
jgi:hypothetical protein